MKELIYSNFQLTRTTGVATIVVIDGVSVEMRKRGGAATPARPKGKKAHPTTKKASGTKPKPPRSPKEPSKATPVRRSEPDPD